MVASATALSLEQHVSSMCVYYCWVRKLIASSRVSLHPTTYFTHHLSIIVISTNYGTLVFLEKILNKIKKMPPDVRQILSGALAPVVRSVPVIRTNFSGALLSVVRCNRTSVNYCSV